MNYLLDTHSFLWFLDGNPSLSENGRREIANMKNNIFLSIASIWEIGIKSSLGKLILNVELTELKGEIIQNEINILPLDFDHIIELTKLGNYHKDPFDRILISQAIVEKLTIISRDSIFQHYQNVATYW